MCTSFLSLHSFSLSTSPCIPTTVLERKRGKKCCGQMVWSVKKDKANVLLLWSPVFFFFFLNDKRCSQDSLLKKQIRHSAVPPSMTPLRNREVSNSCAMMTTVVGCQSAFHNKNQRPCFASYLSAWWIYSWSNNIRYEICFCFTLM